MYFENLVQNEGEVNHRYQTTFKFKISIDCIRNHKKVICKNRLGRVINVLYDIVFHPLNFSFVSVFSRCSVYKMKWMKIGFSVLVGLSNINFRLSRTEDKLPRTKLLFEFLPLFLRIFPLSSVLDFP